jgi:hypothetical protein
MQDSTKHPQTPTSMLNYLLTAALFTASATAAPIDLSHGLTDLARKTTAATTGLSHGLTEFARKATVAKIQATADRSQSIPVVFPGLTKSWFVDRNALPLDDD